MGIKNTIYEEFYNDLYNPDLKVEFIEDYFDKDSTKKVILNNFRKSSYTERKLNKDLCVLNINEINDVVESLGYITENTIRSALSYFSKYVDWCMANKKRGGYENNINDIEIFATTQDLTKFASRIKNKHRYITKQEVYDAVDALDNFQDKALLLGLYEGIAGEELYELRSMEVKNIIEETNQIILTDINGKQRVKTISKELVHILLYANTQEERLIGDKSTLYAKTMYIIKPVTRKKHSKDDMITYNTLSARFQNLKRNIGLDFITPLSVQVSGQIRRIEELTKRYNLNKPNDAVFDELMSPTEYNLTLMQVYNLKQKYKMATELKSFK